MSRIPYAYQSPISLNHKDNIQINQAVDIIGKNNGAKYNDVTYNFEVLDKIILKIDGNRYYLDEYHFHIPAEHVINEHRYKAEVHFVFIELPEGVRYSNRENRHRHGRDICGCAKSHDFDAANVLVIGRTIINESDYYDLSKLQVDFPQMYYEYDGTLTTPTYSPVRWIVGDEPIRLNIINLISVSKPARQTQESDGRIILQGTYGSPAPPP